MVRRYITIIVLALFCFVSCDKDVDVIPTPPEEETPSGQDPPVEEPESGVANVSYPDKAVSYRGLLFRSSSMLRLRGRLLSN